MKTRLEEFNYHLPAGLIAQEPAESRDASRMMILERKNGRLCECLFSGITGMLRKGDCLVINDTRVIPARLVGLKESGGSVEILLLANKGKVNSSQVWEALLKPGRRILPGTRIRFGEDARAEVLERLTERKWVLSITSAISFDDFLKKYGRAPLPPYIRRKNGLDELRDRLRYQTVYAKVPGSVAAPTAGLHFSEGLIERIIAMGVTIAPITLHVGYGTFRPVEAEYIDDHIMEKEYFEIDQESADTINRAGRVVAVGTTSTRVLESVADESGKVKSMSGFTGLFIRPGHRFRRVDALLTNFHLPRSSLFILVSAFAGGELVRKAYARAIQDRYRFYSYGDCMLIL